MRILQIHNHYQFPGGEGITASKEAELLTENGHDVKTYRRDNSEVLSYTLTQLLQLPIQMIWNQQSLKDIQALVSSFKPDVVHFHNTHFMISPAGYYACEDSAVIQTIHNYRLICPAATLYRDNKICELCVDKTFPVAGMIHKCFRGSHTLTGILALQKLVHRGMNTWNNQIDLYITLTNFMRQKLIEGGLPQDKMIVLPNYISPAQTSNVSAQNDNNNSVIFVGRLSQEKGVMIMLEAWRQLRDIKLRIVGDGPLFEEIQQFIQTHQLEDSVALLGQVEHHEVANLLSQSRFLLFPSVWYEGFPLTLMEAYSNRIPVLASNVGTITELVLDGQTGLTFETANPDEIVKKVRYLFDNPEICRQLGQQAYDHLNLKYNPLQHYDKLMSAYQLAIENRAKRQ